MIANKSSSLVWVPANILTQAFALRILVLDNARPNNDGSEAFDHSKPAHSRVVDNPHPYFLVELSRMRCRQRRDSGMLLMLKHSRHSLEA